jgi:hypothetical protein
VLAGRAGRLVCWIAIFPPTCDASRPSKAMRRATDRESEGSSPRSISSLTRTVRATTRVLYATIAVGTDRAVTSGDA